MNPSIKPRMAVFTVFALILSMLMPVYALGSTGVRRLELGVKNVTLKVNQEKTVYVNITPADADDKSVTWSSDDDSVATVLDIGGARATIKAVAEGKTTVTVTSADGKTSSCRVTVSDDDIKISRLQISPASATVRVNQIRHLFADILPVSAEETSIEWTSDNPEIVMVEGDGIILGVSPGTAIITATAQDGKTAECRVTVPSAALVAAAQEVSTGDIPGSQANSGETLSAAALRLDAENAAKADPKSLRITLVYSDKSLVSVAALRSGAFAASYHSKEAVVRFRTMDEDGRIQGQLSLNPKVAGSGDAEINTSVYTAAAQTEKARAQAEKALGKTAVIVWLRQEGAFNMTAQVAAKADLTGLDTAAIKIYRVADGKYILLENKQYVIDDVGFIHFSATDGGVYVLA